MPDAAAYFAIAKRISAGDVLLKDTAIYFTPGYPYLLSVLYAFGDDFLGSLRHVQIVLGASGAAVIASLVASLGGNRAGLITGIILSVSPLLMSHENFYLGEALASPLSAAILFTIVMLHRKASRLWYFLHGASISLACLFRPHWLLVGTILVVFHLVTVRRSRWGRALSFAAGLWLFILPFTVRNFAVHGELIPLSSHSGLNLYFGNNPEATGLFTLPQHFFGGPLDLARTSQVIVERESGSPVSPGVQSAFWTGKVVEFMRKMPLRFLTLQVRKVRFLVANEEASEHIDWERVRALGPQKAGDQLIPFALLCALALVGVLSSTVPGLAKMCAGSLALSILVFFVSTRFRVWLVPWLGVLAGVGTDALIAWASAAIRAPATAFIGRCLGRFLGLAASVGVLLIGFLLPPQIPKNDDVRNPALLNKAIGLFRQSKCADMLDLLQEIGDRVNLEVSFLRALCWSQLGRLDQARDLFETLLASSPLDPRVPYELGVIARKARELEESARYFKMAIDRDPHYSDAYVGLGNTFSEEGLHAEAREMYFKAIDIDPRNASAHLNLAINAFERQDLATANKHIRKAKDIDSSSPQAWKVYGAISQVEGNIGEAISAYRRAIDLGHDPDALDAFRRLCQEYRFTDLARHCH
ncbi:MAG: tetratricopeptide repeat protein [Nitrospirae bacterium]|nr:tetratricopeptide repeat protein [Nitrospirota bacterium]